MTHLEYLEKEKEFIKEKFRYSFINKIISPTKNDFVFYFSKNKNYGIFCSVNNNNPFVKVVNKRFSSSINNNFLNKLKTKLIGAFLEDVNILNNDNILVFDFVKTTDTYDRIQIKMVFEIFKANSNLIFIEEEKIVDALRIKSLETKHPTLIGLTYVLPDKFGVSKEIKESELNSISNYIDEIDEKYLSEKYITILSSLKRKRKTILNRINKLESDKEISKTHLIYKEYGDILLSNIDNIKKGDSEFNYDSYKIPLKLEYSSVQNSQYYYKQYKKSKTALELIDKLIAESKETLTYIDDILNSYKFYNEDDYEELIQELDKNKIIKVRVKKQNKKIKNASNPYFIEYNGIKIGFGKNAKQNNKLTFEYASKNFYYCHIKDNHGPHVVIFDENPSDEVITLALETALYLANKNDGDVLYTKVKNIKKTSTLGLVNVLNYETYHINKFKFNVSELIKNANRL